MQKAIAVYIGISVRADSAQRVVVCSAISGVDLDGFSLC